MMTYRTRIYNTHRHVLQALRPIAIQALVSSLNIKHLPPIYVVAEPHSAYDYVSGRRTTL